MNAKGDSQSQPEVDDPNFQEAMRLEKEWIPDDEFMALARALSRGQGNFTEEEMGQLVQWVKIAKFGSGSLQMVYEGKLNISVRPSGELVFGLVEAEAGDDRTNKVKLEARRLLRELSEDVLKEMARQQGWKTLSEMEPALQSERYIAAIPASKRNEKDDI